MRKRIQQVLWKPIRRRMDKAKQTVKGLNCNAEMQKTNKKWGRKKNCEKYLFSVIGEKTEESAFALEAVLQRRPALADGLMLNEMGMRTA